MTGYDERGPKEREADGSAFGVAVRENSKESLIRKILSDFALMNKKLERLVEAEWRISFSAHSKLGRSLEARQHEAFSLFLYSILRRCCSC